MDKWKSPFVIITITIIFTWFCLVSEFGFAQQSDKSTLLKARMLAEEGDYNGAIVILSSYIEKIEDIKSENQNLHEAYYLFAKIYYMVGEDELCDKYLKKIYTNNPEFQIDETDNAFKARTEEVKNRALVETEVEDKEEAEKKKPEAMKKEADQQTAESKPEIKTEPEQEKEAVPQIKDKSEQEPDTKAATLAKQPDVKVKEEKVDLKTHVKAKEKETKPEKKVIPRVSKKKSKKKFPWLLAVGGVVVAGVILYLLLKPKNDSAPDDGDNGIIPNYDTAVLGIQWVSIPAGEFLMGDNFNEGESDERPVHAVYLDSYSISKYEVTFDQYDNFCEETNRYKPEDEGWGRGNRPVINVSWEDAKAFCDWLSQKTGKNIHLPSEAQWEKAARGTGQRRYPWGNFDPNCGITNYNRCYGRTRPVGYHPTGVSPYGIYDMAGNVWEWCADLYSSTYYSVSPYNNPTGPSNGFRRVGRGGAWYSDAYYIRCTYRADIMPSEMHDYLGFRLAMD